MTLAALHARGKRDRRTRWAVAAGYLLVMTITTHVPSFAPPGPAEQGIELDKLAHLAGYGMLGLILALIVRLRWWQVIGFGLAWTALDELTQPPFGRTADLRDAAANLVGLVAAVGVAAALNRRRRIADGQDSA